MFVEYFYFLKERLPVSITEYMTLMEALNKGLIHNMVEFYYTSRSILCKNEHHIDIYDIAFANFFKEAMVKFPEDIKQLLAVLKVPRDLALILTLLRTGMRIGELLNTRVQDLNLKEHCIEIFEAQKNRVGRVVYLSKDAQAALKKWLKLKDSQTNYLFYGHRDRPLCYEAARAVFKRILDKAQLSHEPYSLHCLRHTFASEMLNGGMSLQSLQELLGHSDIEMTRRYARLTDNTRREEYYKAMQIIERGEINGHYRLDH